MRTASKPSTIFGVIGQVLVGSGAGVALETWVRQVVIGGLGFGWGDGVRFAAIVVAGVINLSSATACCRLAIVVSSPGFVIMPSHGSKSSYFNNFLQLQPSTLVCSRSVES